MERVIVTIPVQGLFCMQACVVEGADDVEILEAANSKNPSGTEAGWARVVEEAGRVRCARHPDRVHVVLEC